MKSMKTFWAGLGATLISFLLIFAGGPAGAMENELGLDSKLNYDVYIGSKDNSGTVIKGVQIVELRQVRDKYFLIVQTDDFAGKKSEGLIALDYVQAVLPSFSLSSPGSRQSNSR